MKEILDQLRGLLRVLWAYRWWGLGAAVLAGAVGSAVVMAIPNKYEAGARIFVDTQSVLKPLMTGLAVQPNIDEQIALMGRTLINRPNVERVMRMADLDLNAKTPQEREQIVDSLMKGISFQSTGRVGRAPTNIYIITYRNERPETAKNVVQALLTIFVESNLGSKRRDSEQARRFIDEQIKLYEQRLLDAENALKEFKLKHMNVMPSLSQDSVEPRQRAPAGACQRPARAAPGGERTRRGAARARRRGAHLHLGAGHRGATRHALGTRPAHRRPAQAPGRAAPALHRAASGRDGHAARARATGSAARGRAQGHDCPRRWCRLLADAVAVQPRLPAAAHDAHHRGSPRGGAAREGQRYRVAAFAGPPARPDHSAGGGRVQPAQPRLRRQQEELRDAAGPPRGRAALRGNGEHGQHGRVPGRAIHRVPHPNRWRPTVRCCCWPCCSGRWASALAWHCCGTS